MMKKLIAALGVFLYTAYQAQPLTTFNRTYNDSLNWSSTGNNVIELNGEFITASRGQGLTLNSNYTMLVKTDQNGELIKRLFTHRPFEKECWGGIGVETTNNNDVYTYVGERLISNPSKLNINITRYTAEFDTVWNLRCSDSTSYDNPLNSKVIQNLIYVVGVRGVENTNPSEENGILYIADTSGNQVNFVQFNLNDIDHYFYSISKGDGSNVLLGGARYDSLYHGLVVKINSQGDILWHRWYPELWGANINSLSDSTYILTGSTPDGYSGRIAKIDADGDVIWMKTFPFGTELNLYNSIKTTDGGIVSVGLTTVTTQNGNDAYIQKLDSEGNLLWQKSFNGIGSGVDFFSNVIETVDGGLLVNGSTNEGFAGGQNLWLVKLDSMGCLEPDCWVGVEQADANTLGVAVYPNPATDWLYLKYDNTHKITLEIFNLSGQRVLQHQHMAPKEGIEISHLPAGLYLLRFVDEVGNVATEKLVVE
jgi:hypothetical protein